jgi:hypothetical protein
MSYNALKRIIGMCVNIRIIKTWKKLQNISAIGVAIRTTNTNWRYRLLSQSLLILDNSGTQLYAVFGSS